MTLELSPKLLDFVEFSDGSSATKRRGTIVEWIGEEALIEISDDRGVPSAFMVCPAHELAKVRDVVIPAAKNVAPPESQSYFENGVLFLQNGLPDRAKEQFRKAFAVEPKFRGTLLHMTNDLGQKGAFETAVFLYTMLLELSPDYGPARENLAVTFLNQGVVRARDRFLPQAMERFNWALMLNPSAKTVAVIRRNIIATYTQLGVLHSDAREYQRAFQWFQMALELDPSDISRRNLAVALIAISTEKARNRDAESIEQIFKQPLLMGLGPSECWTAYGATIASLGDNAGARRAFLAALDANPGNEVARHNLEILAGQTLSEAIGFGLTSAEAEIESLPLSASG